MTSSSGSTPPSTGSSAPSTSAAIGRIDLSGLAAPPRPLPWSLTLQMLAGGPVAIIVVGCVAFFGAMMVLMGVVNDLTPVDAGIDCGRATVVGVSETEESWIVTASDGRGVEVVSHFGDAEPPKGGDVLDVLGDDTCTRRHLRGGRLRPSGWPMVLGLGGPLLLSLPMLWWPLRRRWRQRRLLRDGRPGTARRTQFVAGEDDESSSVITFSFVDDRGRERSLVHATMRPALFLDDEAEPIFYDDVTAVLLDELPGRPRVTDGTFVSAQPVRSLFATAFLVVGVVGAPLAFVVGVMLALR